MNREGKQTPTSPEPRERLRIAARGLTDLVDEGHDAIRRAGPNKSIVAGTRELQRAYEEGARLLLLLAGGAGKDPDWIVVPRLATPEMLAAFHGAQLADRPAQWSPDDDIDPWMALLAAAPDPLGGQ